MLAGGFGLADLPVVRLRSSLHGMPETVRRARAVQVQPFGGGFAGAGADGLSAALVLGLATG
jgi:hypothetical protein